MNIAPSEKYGSELAALSRRYGMALARGGGSALPPMELAPPWTRLQVAAGLLARYSQQRIARGELRRLLLALGQEWLQAHFPSVKPHPANGTLDLQTFINTSAEASAAEVREFTLAASGANNSHPGRRLIRFGTRTDKRNWAERWQAAGEHVRWEGAKQGGNEEDGFLARYDSPIWQALGQGAGGYTDCIGRAVPPFAWGSGMDWEIVDGAGVAL